MWKLYLNVPESKTEGLRGQRHISTLIWRCGDTIESDYFHKIWRSYARKPKVRGKIAHWTWMQNRHAPFAIAGMLEEDCVELAGLTLEQVREEHGHHEHVIRALAFLAVKQGRVDEAVELCEYHLDEFGHSSFVLATLEKQYEQAGRTEDYIAVLHRRLALPAHGLDHTRAFVKLAIAHYGKGDIRKTVEFTDRAAQSGASWAMTAAASAREAIGNVATAERWMVRTAHRYTGGRAHWYNWHRRRGSVPPAKAVKLRRERLQQMRRSSDVSRQNVVVFGHMIAGEHDRAHALAERLLAENPASRALLYGSLFAAHFAGKAERARELALLIREHGHVTRGIEGPAGLLIDWIGQGEAVDPREAREALAQTGYGTSNGGGFSRLAVPVMLEMAGLDDLAAEDYQRVIRGCAEQLKMEKWHAILAWQQLRDHGIDPEESLGWPLRSRPPAAP